LRQRLRRQAQEENKMKPRNCILNALLVGSLATLMLTAALAAEVKVPAPGTSPRIDAIVKAGGLRVGVFSNPPWLLQNTSGVGDSWQGPAWQLAKRAAADLHVALVPVEVSNETKVPALAANQIDITITPLAWSAERAKVIDFVNYSANSVCMIGLATNAKFAAAKTVDDLNKPGTTVAYLIGSPEEQWIKQRFPNSTIKGVVSTNTFPLEEIMTGRSDATHINRVEWIHVSHSVKGLAVLPKENDCQDSKEMAADIGLGIDKGQDVFRTWLQAIVHDMQPQLAADEQRVLKERN
jgi:polar amino acid transport system substrate-binding protein